MLLIDCPYCKEMRPEIEFAHAGEAHIERPANPASLSDAQWESFLFLRSNQAGICFERWYHVHGCGRYFNAVRNNVSEKFILTYQVDQKRPSDTEIQVAQKSKAN